MSRILKLNSHCFGNSKQFEAKLGFPCSQACAPWGGVYHSISQPQHVAPWYLKPPPVTTCQPIAAMLGQHCLQIFHRRSTFSFLLMPLIMESKMLFKRLWKDNILQNELNIETEQFPYKMYVTQEFQTLWSKTAKQQNLKGPSKAVQLPCCRRSNRACLAIKPG